MTGSLKQVRDRIASVKNTKKITDAMKLVAAAKVRRAQDAVINGRPFAENLVKVCDVMTHLSFTLPYAPPIWQHRMPLVFWLVEVLIHKVPYTGAEWLCILSDLSVY